MGRKMKWQKIDGLVEDQSIESPSKSPLIHEWSVAGKTICLAKHDGKWFAFAARCPHASGSLAEGWMDPLGNVVCPLHRYKFNITNGRNTSGEGYHLKTYPVEVREGSVYVGFEEGGFSIFG
jgi:3-phenylpropionate/trans-cinnamate dioxygenase ferredoxin subunit